MHFIGSAIFSLKIIIILIFSTSTIYYLLNKQNAARRLLLTGILVFLVAGTKFLPKILVGKLEEKYNPVISADRVNIKYPIYIAILGSGYSDDLTLPPNDRLYTTTLARLTEGIRLYKLFGQGKIVAGGISEGLKLNQAQVIVQAAVSLGICRDSVRCFPIPANNTHGEAIGYMKEFGKTGTLILVTDAIHMPRAMMLFRRAGIDPVPAPTNHIIKNSSNQSPFSWLPCISNLSSMDAAIHEYLGILWIKMGGT